MNVLVVTWDGGGNRQPFEVVVDALVARGDTVRIISNEVHRDLYGSLGASFVSLDVADKDPATRSDLETQIGRAREVMFSPLTSRTVLQNVEDADVGLVDVVMLSAQAACERATAAVRVHAPHSLWRVLGRHAPGNARELPSQCQRDA